MGAQLVPRPFVCSEFSGECSGGSSQFQSWFQGKACAPGSQDRLQGSSVCGGVARFFWESGFRVL